MKKFSYNCLLFFAILLGTFNRCKTPIPDKMVAETFPEFYMEGHRGARGLMPENTIPSMKKAISEGANVLEVDVQISKDNQVVVTHDPFINRKITLLPNGKEIPEEDSKKYLIYEMDYSDIRKFDVGSKLHSRFPKQQKVKTYIPLLGELIDSVENYTSRKELPGIIYNVEIKANPEKDGEYQPNPEKFMKLVMEVLEKKPIGNRFYIQSFDIRQIQEVHKNYPGTVIGFLTGNKNFTFEENIERIGFYPEIYSPHFKMITDSLVIKANKNNIKLIPWTVNSKKEMKKLIDMGIDGIITDYPNLLKEVVTEQELKY